MAPCPETNHEAEPVVVRESVLARIRLWLPWWVARLLRAAKSRDASVSIERVVSRNEHASGSGVVLFRDSQDAYVLTAFHNVGGSGEVRVNGAPATVLRRGDDGFDLALLKARIDNPALDLRRWWPHRRARGKVYGYREVDKAYLMQPQNCRVTALDSLLIGDTSKLQAGAPLQPAPTVTLASKNLTAGYSGGTVLASPARALIGLYAQGKRNEDIAVRPVELPSDWKEVPPIIRRRLRPKKLWEVLLGWAIPLAFIALQLWPFWGRVFPPAQGFAQRSCKTGCFPPLLEQDGNPSVRCWQPSADGGAKISGKCFSLYNTEPLTRSIFVFDVTFLPGNRSPLYWYANAKSNTSGSMQNTEAYQFEIPSDWASREIVGTGRFRRRWWNVVEKLFLHDLAMERAPSPGGDLTACSGFAKLSIQATIPGGGRAPQLVATAGKCEKTLSWDSGSRFLAAGYPALATLDGAKIEISRLWVVPLESAANDSK